MRRSPFLPTPAPKKAGNIGSPPADVSGFFRPYGLEQNRSVPPAMLAAWGSSVKSNVVSNANVAVPTPAAKLPPIGSIYFPRPDRSCRFPSSQAAGENVTNNPAPLERGKTRTRFPLCQASSLRSKILNLKPVIHSIPRQLARKMQRHFPRQPLLPKITDFRGKREKRLTRIAGKRRSQSGECSKTWEAWPPSNDPCRRSASLWRNRSGFAGTKEKAPQGCGRMPTAERMNTFIQPGMSPR